MAAKLKKVQRWEFSSTTALWRVLEYDECRDVWIPLPPEPNSKTKTLGDEIWMVSVPPTAA